MSEQKSKLQFKIQNGFHIKILNFTLSFSILIFTFFIFTTSAVFASETNGTITSGGNNGYAWSNQAGWVNFGCSNCGISIVDSEITGHAWSNNYGWINMSPANGGVTVAANGALSGYAWGSGLGWINFSGVSINSSGKFVGTASGTNVGALTFDCANCSVTTDFKAQNFRKVAPAPTTVISGGGGGGGGGGGIPYVSGPGGQLVPAHISAFNVPMRLYPAQSGILTQGLTNQKSVVLDVPTNVFSDKVTFVVKEEAVSTAPTAEIQVIGNALFNVLAVDKNGNQAQTFEKPIKITFIVPGSMQGRSDLAVYFFNDATNLWIKIPDAVFSGDSVSFSVNHLTLFAIFAGSELPLAAAPTFPLPIPFEFEIPRGETGTLNEEIGTPVEDVTTTVIETISKENQPLFDVEVSPGPSESKKTRGFALIAVFIIAVAGAISYFLRKIRKNQR